jgi:hypothetical protein
VVFGTELLSTFPRLDGSEIENLAMIECRCKDKEQHTGRSLVKEREQNYTFY